MLSDIGNYYGMCHHNLCKNKALYGVIIICINHKLWSPFWWFNSWIIATESKYMSVSGTSIGKFNFVCNIPVETLRSFIYIYIYIFVLASVSTCRMFNVMLSDIGNYYNMCHSSFYKKLLLNVYDHPFWWFIAWNIPVCQSSSIRDHMTAIFKNVCWASIIVCIHLI